MDSTNVALEELKLLQAIIARQDEMRFRIKTWAITIFSALALGLFSEKISLSEWDFLVAVLLVAGLFWSLDAIYRTAESRAIHRSRKIEACLRESAPYEGPSIATSLSTVASWREFIGAVKTGRVFALYLVLILLAAAMFALRAL